MITSTLWVVVLRMHVADRLNIEAEEKERLLKYFEGLKQPAIIRETHYYVTADKEKDQGMVQHILTDISNYLKGRGRWAGVGRAASHLQVRVALGLGVVVVAVATAAVLWKRAATRARHVAA